MLVVSGGGRVAQAVTRSIEDAGAGARVATLEGLASPGERVRILDGVRQLVLLPSFDPRGVEQLVAIVAMAKQCGVERIHLLSLAGADERSPVTLLRWLGLIERAIRATGLRHSVMRCTPFMQSIPLFIRRDAQGVAIAGPFRDAAFPWLHAGDAGTIVANLARDPAPEDFACQLSGPDELGFESIAGMLAASLGAPVRYVDLCLPETQGFLEARGLSPQRIRVVTEYWDFLVSGVVRSACCDTASRLLGHAPRGVAAYLNEYAATLRPVAA